MTFESGQIIINGSSAGEILHRVTRDPYWKCGGWRIRNIPLTRFGGNAGQTSFVPDYIMSGWRAVNVGEWAPVTGSKLEARYVWSGDWTYLMRELRPTT